MPNCVVKGCKNQTTRDKKQYGITYHTFPNRDQNMKDKWIAVIRDSRKEPSWQPTRRSVVCSAHFDGDDLYYTKKGLRRVVKDGYPKQEDPAAPFCSNDFNLGQPSSSCAQAEPATPDLSNDLNLGQPSSSCAQEEPAAPDLSNDLSLSQPSSCVVTVQEEPAALDLSKDLNLSQPFSCSVQAVQSDLSIFDTLTKYKLRQRVLLLEKIQEINKQKIKTLNQKVRRLTKRNNFLNEIRHNLRKHNYIDTDLFHSLYGNIAVVDMFNALKRKMMKKKIKFTPAMKKFCLTLNYHSPKAYEYVRSTFNMCLPHPKTLAKWYGPIKGQPGFTEESFQALKAKSEIREHKPICSLVLD